MDIALTITNAKGEKICDREIYSLAEIRRHPGFTTDEQRCFVDLLPDLSVEWNRGGSTIRLERA